MIWNTASRVLSLPASSGRHLCPSAVPVSVQLQTEHDFPALAVTELSPTEQAWALQGSLKPGVLLPDEPTLRKDSTKWPFLLTAA